MSHKRYFFIYWICFFVCLVPVAAQQASVKIDGIPVGTSRFSVVSFKDYISLSPEFLAERNEISHSVDMHFPLTQPRWVRVSAQGIHKDLIAAPGAVYQLSVKSDGDYEPYMELSKDGIASNDPNLFVDSVNILINEYVYKHGATLFSGVLARQTIRYCDSLEKVFAVQPDMLFQTFLGFRLDELRMLSRAWTDHVFYKNRFEGRVFQPENPDYAYAFCEFYKGRFAQLFLKNNLQQGLDLINNFKGANAVINLISNEPFYPKNEMGEGALLYGLTELLPNKKYSKDGILFLFHQMADSSQYPAVKNLAERLYKKYRNPVNGEQAPALQVEDKTGKKIDVGLDATRRTYLCFMDPNSQTIVAELGAITELKKNVKDKMLIVPVIINADATTLTRLQSHQKLSFELYRNITSGALADFRLKTDCTCMILSPDGKYVMPNAPLPTSPDANITIPNMAQIGR